MSRHQVRRRVETARARHRARPLVLGEHEDGSRQRTTCAVLLAASGGLAAAAITALALSGGPSSNAAPDRPSATEDQPPPYSPDGSPGRALAGLGTTDSPAFAHLGQYGAGEGWRAVPCIGLTGFTWGELDVLIRTVDAGDRTADVDRPDAGWAETDVRAVLGAPRDAGSATISGGSAPASSPTAAGLPTGTVSRPQATPGDLGSGQDGEPAPGPGSAGPDPEPRPTELVPGEAGPVREPAQRVPEPVRETVQPAPDPVREPVDRVSEPVREPVERVSEPVREPVERVSEPVRETVERVSEPVRETVEPVTEPVRETVEPVSEPVRETVEPVSEPVEQVVQQAPTQPVTDTLEESGLLEGSGLLGSG